MFMRKGVRERKKIKPHFVKVMKPRGLQVKCEGHAKLPREGPGNFSHYRIGFRLVFSCCD